MEGVTTINFRIIGKRIFLVENGPISKEDLDFGSIALRIENPKFESYSGFGMYVYDSEDYLIKDYDDEEDNGEFLIEVKDNTNYTIAICGTKGYERYLIAQGRFSIIEGVVCDNPDFLSLNFWNIKESLIELSNKFDALESKTNNIAETLNGYTTE